MKEAKDFRKASNKRSENSYKGDTYPPNDMATGGKGREFYQDKANAARQNQDAQLGQMIGALVQGRRYEDKTGKQIKKK
jgi:hypothetical protein